VNNRCKTPYVVAVPVVSFSALLAKACDGDQEAAAELVRHYQPHVHRFVRFRLAGWRLRRQIDSLDVCQAVFGDFFARLSQGGLRLESPRQLLALLLTMARNVLCNNVQQQHAARRDIRRLIDRHVDELELADDGATPSQAAARNELLIAISVGLDADETTLVDHWLAGKPWAEIGQAAGQPPDAMRMRLQRLLKRICRQLD
jgi:RNA polymerase sigma factor (sigma-70 family)